jgi:hypothetical protein
VVGKDVHPRLALVQHALGRGLEADELVFSSVERPNDLVELAQTMTTTTVRISATTDPRPIVARSALG